MPFIDLSEQAIRARALREPVDDTVREGLISGIKNFGEQFVSSRNKAREAELKREEEDRKSALDFEKSVTEKGISEGYLRPLGRSVEGEGLSPSEIILQGQKFEKLGGKPPTGLTFEQQKELANIRAGQKDTPFSRATQNAKAKEIVDIDKKIRSVDVTEQLLSDIEADAGLIKDKIGPYQGRFESLKESIGAGDPQFTEVATRIRANIGQTVKELSGAAASDRERQEIAKYQPSVNDTPEQLNAKVNALRRISQTQRETLLTQRGDVERGVPPGTGISRQPVKSTLPRGGVTRSTLQPPGPSRVVQNGWIYENQNGQMVPVGKAQ